METDLRTFKIGCAVALSLVAGGGASAHAGRSADPETLNRQLAEARGGETIVLAPGQYGDVTTPPRAYRAPVKVDASAAQFTGIVIRHVDGLVIDGGSVVGPREKQFAVVIDSSAHVALRHMKIAGPRIGITVARSHDIVVAGNDFNGARSDGVNIAGSQRVLVADNTCVNFDPIMPVYDGGGKLLKDGDHPDCVQAWSIVGLPPTADITVERNTGKGFMQGVFFGNRDSGGYDRVIVRDNIFDLSAWNGVVLMEARNSHVYHNVVRTIPGARALNYPHYPVISWVRADGDGTVVCGNKVDDPRRSTDRGKCRPDDLAAVKNDAPAR